MGLSDQLIGESVGSHLKNNKFLLILRNYYLLTPLWAVAELILKVPLRVGSFISSPVWRGIYYVGCTLSGLAMFRWPRTAGLLSLSESVLNMTILVVGFMNPLLTISMDAVERGSWDPLTPMASLLNFILAGTVSLISYYSISLPTNSNQSVRL